jgi:hypothetical protein
MELNEYFESRTGVGILATADAEGRVDAAIYARPHVMADDALAFIMADRLSHRNLQSNPHAVYLFIEKGEGYEGVRFHLTKTEEETDPARIEAFRRRTAPQGTEGRKRYLVHFNVDRVRPLVGEGPEDD